MLNTTTTTATAPVKKAVRTFVADTDAVQGMLDEVQSGRMSRTLTAEDIASALAQAEAELTRLRVSKKARADIEIIVDLTAHRQPKVNSYSYQATVSYAVLRFAPKGWFVEKIARRGALSDTLANGRDFSIVFNDEVEKAKAVRSALNLAGIA